jgi:tetratricopeptide (TPR) repeat protein
MKKHLPFLKIAGLSLLIMVFGQVFGQDKNEWLNKGNFYDSIGDYRKSIECYTNVLKLDKGNPIALNNRSVAFVGIGKPGLALVDLNVLIYSNDAIADAFFNRYALHLEAGNYEFAMGDMNRYIDLSPNDMIALVLRAELAVNMEYYDVAIIDLVNVLKVKEDDIDLQIALAEVFAKSNKLDSATNLLNRLSLKPNVNEEQLYLVNALILSKSGNYKESNEKLNLFLLNKPKERGPLKLKADNLFFLKEYENALSLYKKMMATDSADYALWADIGHCYLQLELYSEALDVLSKSVQKRNAQPAYAYLGRGIAYFNLKKYNQACGDWQKSALLGNAKAKEFLNAHCIKD